MQASSRFTGVFENVEDGPHQVAVQHPQPAWGNPDVRPALTCRFRSVRAVDRGQLVADEDQQSALCP